MQKGSQPEVENGSQVLPLRTWRVEKIQTSEV
jgi:hypothetical protein